MSTHKGTRAFFQLSSLLVKRSAIVRRLLYKRFFSLSGVKFNSTYLIARILHNERISLDNIFLLAFLQKHEKPNIFPPFVNIESGLVLHKWKILFGRRRYHLPFLFSYFNFLFLFGALAS